MIAFSSRRGLDTKGDSLALGIDMFYSPYRFQSKPYLLKVLDIEASDIMIGQVMMLDKFKISTVVDCCLLTSEGLALDFCL